MFVFALPYLFMYLVLYCNNLGILKKIYGLGADLSLLSLPVGDDRYLNLSSQTKATHGPKSRRESFGSTFWLHVQRYCCLGVLFAHEQVPSHSSSYHIRGNEKNCVGSSEYMTAFTSLTHGSFINILVRLVVC